jgi:DNA-binding response OmpR family regulator
MQPALIAIIDDDQGVQEMLHAVLTAEGYCTLRWSQGKDAHLRIREAQPNLVMLDLRMEDPKAGSTVLDLIQADPRTKHIPVIICSAYFLEMRRLFRRGSLKGCAMVDKPFNVDEFLEKVRALLRRDAGA